MTNTVNRMKLALVLALVAGLLAATIGLFGSGWPPSVSAQTDTTAPTVSSVAITSDAGNGVYGIGDDIEATVTFSEDVTVTDTPRLGLDIGGTSKTASYESTSGSTVVFSYTVVEGDSAPDGVAIPANAISLNGGSIRDRAGNDAVLTHSAVSADSLSWTFIPVTGFGRPLRLSRSSPTRETTTHTPPATRSESS